MFFAAVSKAFGLNEGGATRGTLASLWKRLALLRSKQETPVHLTVAFTIAVTTLSAKMAKADGVALPVEERAFERLFSIPENEAKNVRRLYSLAAKDTAGFEVYARKIATLLRGEPQLLKCVFECLFCVAAADGILHPAEDQFLEIVAQEFGLSRGEFLSIRASFIHDPDSPYDILGVRPEVSDEDLRSRYIALVREHHPDRLMASGVPVEFRVAADRRLAAINAAYEAILEMRGRKHGASEAQHP